VELEQLDYEGHGGERVAAWYVGPAPESLGGAGPRPGLLLVHEVYGLDAHVEDLARRFAAEGHAVLAPDLWSREGRPGPAPTADEPAPAWPVDTIRAAVEGLPDRRALGDLEAGLAWLAERDGVDAGRLAVCGLCMGGNLAFQLACTSRRLAAAVDFYGRLVYRQLSAAHPIQPLELALNLSCPVLFHFGTEDASIPPADLERLRQTLDPFMKDYVLERWAGAGHGFFNPLRPGYHEPSARGAWERTAGFLRDRLETD
jgi:carboxymethylenebutenolidase